MNPDRQLPVLRIELRPSIELALLLGGVHLAAAAMLVYVLSAKAWVIALCCVIAFNALWVVRRHALLRYADAVVGFDLAGEDDCVLQLRSGEQILACVLPTTYVTPWLVVVTLQTSQRWRRRHVVIWRDTLPADILRRLRVRLRWARLEVPRHRSAGAPL